MMCPSELGCEEGRRSNVTLMPSNKCTLKERNYLRLSSDCSSVNSSAVSGDSKNLINLKATELRLGLPGSQSPQREDADCELSLFNSPLAAAGQKPVVVSGNKRGFFDSMDNFSAANRSSVYSEKNWLFHSTAAAPATAVSDSPSSGPKSGLIKLNQTGDSNNTSTVPAAKAQVVGWPPIKSFRKNTFAISSKNNDEVDGKPGPGTLFVKVSMDGAPYLRKVDLTTYSAYQELSRALEKMFSCFTIGQCGSHGAPGRAKLSESKLRDLLNGSEYVLTYEDKDGDWMLVGDVPWEMFIETCKRLKIMKSSDAIGLAPRASEKSKIKE